MIREIKEELSPFNTLVIAFAICEGLGSSFNTLCPEKCGICSPPGSSDRTINVSKVLGESELINLPENVSRFEFQVSF